MDQKKQTKIIKQTKQTTKKYYDIICLYRISTEETADIDHSVEPDAYGPDEDIRERQRRRQPYVEDGDADDETDFEQDSVRQDKNSSKLVCRNQTNVEKMMAVIITSWIGK